MKPVCMIVKNPQANSIVEWMHQVLYKTIINKDLDKNVFDYIYSLDETLASIEWAIRISYQCTIGYTPCQDVFVRYMIFIITSVIY